MPCSPAQRAANKRNGQKSRGPSTLEGKLMSRKNGYKHGMTGVGIVIADEDGPKIDERFEIFERDLKPANEVARLLTQRAAFLSLRLERSAREESSRINKAMLLANVVEEEARHDEIERLVLLIPQEPAEAIRKLRRSPEGIDRLIGGWETQKATLLNPFTSIGTGDVLYYLMGRHPLNSPVCRVTVLIRALGFNFTWLSETDWPDLPEHERKEMARGELVEIIDREIAGLKIARAALDHEAIAKIRAGADTRAITSTTKEAILAKKYEASDERNLHKALKQVAEINAQVAKEMAARAKTEGKPEQETACGELGSSLPGDSKVIAEVKPAERWVGRESVLAGNGGQKDRDETNLVGSTT